VDKPSTGRIVPAAATLRHLDRTISSVTNARRESARSVDTAARGRTRPPHRATEGPFALADTPLIRSRSLGELLGFAALSFKLESLQATGTWLDRDAVELVRAARTDGLTGLCVVGDGPLVLPLAVQCARAGLRLVVLAPACSAEGEPQTGTVTPDPRDDRRWLSTLGALQIDVAAAPADLLRSAPRIADQSGLRLVQPAADSLAAGLAAISAEIAAAGVGTALLAVPDVSGSERGVLAGIVGERTRALPLPLDDPAGADSGRPAPLLGVVGELAGVERAARLPEDTANAESSAVLSLAVSPREADAARALLAREEGLLVSQAGATGLAALIRAVREDRARRPREQRLARRPEAVVVLAGSPMRGGADAARASGANEHPIVALADLEAAPARWLVRPPSTDAGTLG
jgi:threonine dehydratase